jgi:MFS family permease
VTRVNAGLRTTFAALSVPNYRRYFAGQSVSLTGTWMQMAAQAWLVLSLSHSATMLGALVALQSLPVLVLGPYGGVVADRVDKRRLMVALQAAMGVQALVLGVLTVSGAARLWEIGLLAALLGLNNAFEAPARHAFMLELVGPESLRNAVSELRARQRRPRARSRARRRPDRGRRRGVCFLLNAELAAVLASLLASTAAPSPREPGPGAGQLPRACALRQGAPELGVPLGMMALAGALAYEFQVTLPVMASQALHAGARGFGFMTAAMGLGAVVGGLLVAARGRTGLPPLTAAACAFGVLLLAASLAPGLAVELVALSLVGGASITFMSTGNSTLRPLATLPGCAAA